MHKHGKKPLQCGWMTNKKNLLNILESITMNEKTRLEEIKSFFSDKKKTLSWVINAQPSSFECYPFDQIERQKIAQPIIYESEIYEDVEYIIIANIRMKKEKIKIEVEVRTKKTDTSNPLKPSKLEFEVSHEY